MSVDRLAASLPVASGRETARAAWEALQGRRWLLGLSVIVCAVGAGLSLVTPMILGRVVDDISSHRPGSSALVYGAAILGTSVGSAVLAVVGVLLAARTLERLLAGWREELVETVLRMEQQHIERTGTGDLVSRSSDDVAQVSEALSRVLPTLATTGLTILATAVGMTALDWRYGIVMVVVPLYIVATRWYLRIAPPMYAAERAAVGTRAHHLLSALKGRDTVLAFRLSDRHNRRIATASWAVARWSLLARAVQTMFLGRLDLAFVIALGILLCVGFRLVGTGASTIGTATAAVLLLLRLGGPIRQLMIVADTLQSATASLSRIVGVAQIKTSAVSLPVGRSSTPQAPVRMQHVGFGYRSDQPVLHDLSLQIGVGERLAVVGTSGAGKSTLAAVLAGIHPPTGGFTERPADTMLITQEAHVFIGTLRDNLTLVAPGADDGRIRRALTAAGLDEFVMALPDGLDEQLGASGSDLTAAQAQQLALARVILAEPMLIILDEAAAEAGSAHAEALDRAVDVAMSGRTALVIAHRLSQAARCDRIVVMSQGRITEQGSHSELVAFGGDYARLWQATEAAGSTDPTGRHEGIGHDVGRSRG